MCQLPENRQLFRAQAREEQQGMCLSHFSVLCWSVHHQPILQGALSRTRSFLQCIRWFQNTEERKPFSNSLGYLQSHFCISCNRNERYISKQGTAPSHNQQPERVGKIFRLLVPSSLPYPCLPPKLSWLLKLAFQLDPFIPALIFGLSSWKITT